MKLIHILTFASIVFFFGCDQSSEITSPQNESPNKQLKAQSVFTSYEDVEDVKPYLHRENDLTNTHKYPPGADSIFVPLNLPPSVVPNLEVSDVIDGESGGYLRIYETFSEGEGIIIIYARIDIPENAFSGSQEIRMELNNENGIISFYPHMEFKEPVIFNSWYGGIDLSGVEPDSVDFKFQNYNGTLENVEYDYIHINNFFGVIEIDDAELHHFSRYGFVNRTF